jgi:hypothetical protein
VHPIEHRYVEESDTDEQQHVVFGEPIGLGSHLVQRQADEYRGQFDHGMEEQEGKQRSDDSKNHYKSGEYQKM